MTDLETLDVDALAVVLGRAPRSIYSDMSRNPRSLPPRIRIPGNRRALWLASDVRSWLESHREKPLGRPRSTACSAP
jgi:predicted DNA-binding transcriptional regulator AlpA